MAEESYGWKRGFASGGSRAQLMVGMDVRELKEAYGGENLEGEGQTVSEPSEWWRRQ